MKTSTPPSLQTAKTELQAAARQLKQLKLKSTKAKAAARAAKKKLKAAKEVAKAARKQAKSLKREFKAAKGVHAKARVAFAVARRREAQKTGTLAARPLKKSNANAKPGAKRKRVKKTRASAPASTSFSVPPHLAQTHSATPIADANIHASMGTHTPPESLAPEASDRRSEAGDE